MAVPLPLQPVAVPAPATPLEATNALLRELTGTVGVCARMVHDHLDSGGKQIRARLALDATAALGGDAYVAVPWAAACEALHNASLVHDDLQDGDEVRRGRPALWSVWGAAQAINAGDLLLMLPTLALARLKAPDAVKWQLALCVAHHGACTARGQSDELDLRRLSHLTPEAYRHAAVGKTAGLFGMPVEGAALLAGRSLQEARALAAPFERLGLLYQLQDDVVDLYGDKGRGDPGADVREGKVSALVVAHLALHPGDRLWLTSILRTPREAVSDADVAAVTARFRDGGALAEVLTWIEDLAAGLLTELAGEPALAEVAAGLRDRVLAPLAPLRAAPARRAL
jgi:geranylgeranyl diphosphate synthase type I